MKRFGALAAMALLLVAAPAFAQVGNDLPLSPADTNGSQKEVSTVGNITEIDLAAGRMMLDNGMQFQLAPSLQYTSTPRVGDEVEVIYDQEGSQYVAHSVDSGFYGHSSHD